MTYSKYDFEKIAAELKRHLYENIDDPLPCRLFEFEMLDGRDKAKLKNGKYVDHVADACNLASSIEGIYGLLTLVRNDDDCERLSRVLVRELGALREAVQNAVEEQISYEKNVLNVSSVPGFSAKPAEKNIRLWADILKHPAATIVAHQCFTNENEAEFIIDTAKMRVLESKMREIYRADVDVDCNTSKAWRKVWEKYTASTVQFTLPSVKEIELFLKITAERIQNLIDRRE